MVKITRMTIAEAKKLYTPAQVKTMIAKAKAGRDDNPFTAQEWWAKAERPNRGRPRLEVHKVGTYIRFAPDVLEKLRSLGKGWQSKLSAKVTQWVRLGLL